MSRALKSIAENFRIEGEIYSIKPLGEGFINDTYIVQTVGKEASNYLFQRKNKTIFKDVPSMMGNIQKITTHLKTKIVAGGGNPFRETLTLIKTHHGALYHLDGDGEYWAMCLFIKDSMSYDSADTPELAYSGGKGIGRFQRMTSDYKGQLVDILPGFQEISWIEERRDDMLKFWTLVEEGAIPTRVTHNDTKINNILFNKEGDVLCMIDLDTVLNSTVLNDFGDAIRSYTNTGFEDDPELENVSMDLEIFKAYTKGYLEEAKSFLEQTELDYLAFSAKYITYEQVLRFLMDYIAGDTYYKIKYPEHNLVRTKAQFKLLQSMEAQFTVMRNTVKSYL